MKQKKGRLLNKGKEKRKGPKGMRESLFCVSSMTFCVCVCERESEKENLCGERKSKKFKKWYNVTVLSPLLWTNCVSIFRPWPLNSFVDKTVLVPPMFFFFNYKKKKEVKNAFTKLDCFRERIFL